MSATDLLFNTPPIADGALVFGAEVPGKGDLIFNSPPTPAGSANLVFGGTASAPPPPPVFITQSIHFAAPGFGMAVVYDNRVARSLSSRTSAAHQVANQAFTTTTSSWALSSPQIVQAQALWGTAKPLQTSATVPIQPAQQNTQSAAIPWQKGAALQAQANGAHQAAIPYQAAATALWQIARQTAATSSAGHQAATRLHADLQALWQLAQQASQQLAVPSGRSTRNRSTAPVLVWQIAGQARGGRSVWPPVVSVPAPFVPDANLLFQCPLNTSTPLELLFGSHPCSNLQPAATFFILPARFYMTTHNLIAHRLPDLAEVPLYDCTVSADVGSFAWQLSASGPESLFTQLAPTEGAALPQQLQITLDGLVWVFAVESLKRSHQFGKRSVAIGGRSVTALVGAPWLRDRSFNNQAAANAQQLAAQALDLTGVALDWGITDWLVPSGAYSYAGTPLGAVQAIAQAAGGYVQSHRSAAALQVRHPYPPRPSGDSGGPWNWGLGNADIELSPDAVITSSIERRDGADINGVYVSGTTQGVLAWVKRAGSAGNLLAAQQTDALITASQAAQQRGLAILGKGGAQYAVGLELPVLTGPGQPGVIDVGSLIQVNEPTPWRGRVRSVQVNAAMPTARQTITLERHL